MSDDEQASEPDPSTHSGDLSSFSFAVTGDEWSAAHADADAALRQLRDALEEMDALTIHLDANEDAVTLIFEGEAPTPDSDTTERCIHRRVRDALSSYGIPD